MLQKTKYIIAIVMIVILLLIVGIILFFTLKQDTGTFTNARYIKVWAKSYMLA